MHSSTILITSIFFFFSTNSLNKSHKNKTTDKAKREERKKKKQQSKILSFSFIFLSDIYIHLYYKVKVSSSPYIPDTHLRYIQENNRWFPPIIFVLTDLFQLYSILDSCVIFFFLPEKKKSQQPQSYWPTLAHR